ncbi:MAG TPA: hypothetical protein VFB68_18370 [Xanthobacteraceae bacterium]|nr:hypothetical protein [Xanthobacteraceae bacterium]
MTDSPPDNLRVAGRRNPSRTLSIVVICIAALIAGPVILYKLAYPDYQYRYRLTLAIEADGKVHTGSSVIEVTWHGQPYVPGAGSYFPHVGGQAVVIDLGSRGTVIAALTAGQSSQEPLRAIDALFLVPRAFGIVGGDKVLPQLTRLSGRRELTPDNMPRLLWLSDVSDPKTIRQIKPEDIPNIVGPDARLKAAQVEITRDPIVIDIDKKLPWYSALEKLQKGRSFTGRPGEFQLYYSMFVGEAS